MLAVRVTALDTLPNSEVTGCTAVPRTEDPTDGSPKPAMETFDGSGLKHFANHPTIKELRFFNAKQMTQENLRLLGEMPKLEKVTLPGTRLQEETQKYLERKLLDTKILTY